MMSKFPNRRVFLAGLGATTALSACGNGVGSNNGPRIDARVDSTRNYLFSRYPGTAELEQKAAGVLFMPLVTKAGFGVGGSYGRGALRIDNATVDYYNAIQANIGFQIGAQQYAHALFFMTDEALMNFRRSPGWAAAANIEYATPEKGETLAAETTTSMAPVIAVIFGQSGLRVGATLEGTKYTRIIP